MTEPLRPDTAPPADDARTLLAIARRKFTRMAEALDARITALSDDDEADDAPAKPGAQAVGDYEKALVLVLERIARIESRESKENTDGTGDILDLDSARADVERRLARLARVAGDGTVSE